MLKFGFYTDTHLIGINPEKRIDEYPKSILAKIRECYGEFKNHGCEFVCFGGDLFHSHRIYSYDAINEFIEILEDYGGKTYFIIGQHDLYGYNPDSFDTSTLRFVEKRSNGLFSKINGSIELDNCIVHASHVYDKVSDKLSAVEPNDKFQVMLVHELLNNKLEVFDIVSTSDLPQNNVNLVLSGDLHSGYEYHTIGKTAYYNPGSLSRVKNDKSNRERKIKCGLFTVDEFLDTWSIDLKEHKLISVRPADEVFKKDVFSDIDEDYTVNVKGFVKEITDLNVDTMNIFELVSIIGKQTNKDIGLLDYIMKFREKTNG